MQMAKWMVGGLAVAIALALSGTGVFAQYDYGKPASGPSLQDEVKTAVTHAGFAARYDTMKEVTMHLHHVLNCLAGPKDTKMYDASAGNPCQGQGNGIVPDLLQAGGKDLQSQAKWAARIADEALGMKTLDEVKSGAHVVQLTLEDLQKKVK